MAHGMPRLDLLRASGEPTSYRAGFWGHGADRAARRRATLELGLRARLRGRRRADRRARAHRDRGAAGAAARRAAGGDRHGGLRAAARPVPPPGRVDPGTDAHRLGLRRQRRLLGPRAVRRAGGGGRRRPAVRRLALAPAARLLPQLRAGAGAGPGRRAGTSPSPTRTTSGTRTSSRRWCARSATRGSSTATSGSSRPAASVVAATYWSHRANNHADMLSLLVANCVTGAASLFPRDLLDDALPFPPAQFAALPRPLDRPHRARARRDPRSSPARSTTTCSTSTRRSATPPRPGWCGLRDRLVVAPPRAAGAHPAVAHALLRRRLPPAPVRDGPRAALRRPDGPAQARHARPLRARRRARCSRIPGLFARGARELLRRRPETLGAEWMLGYAFAWRRLLAASARDRPQRTARLDALPPRVLSPDPRVRVPGDPDLRAVAEQVLPLRLAVADDAPQRVNLLVPGVDPREPFEGVHRALHLARRLAERGYRVRVVTVDPVLALPRAWRARSRRAPGWTASSPPSRWSSAGSRRDRGQPDGRLRRHRVAHRPGRPCGAAGRSLPSGSCT